mmetsp:Transcript_59922/g.111034  ORF Transcript_59922/g.111034 Transcript_59922/m.111034 type:complete len:327 (+) Transcript_59922:1656-2636(+)
MQRDMEMVINSSLEWIVARLIGETAIVIKLVSQEIVNFKVPKIVLQEQMINKSVMLIMDVRVHQPVQEIVNPPTTVNLQVPKYLQVERMVDETMEKIMDVPVHQAVSETVKFKVPKVVLSEQMMNQSIGAIMDVPVHQTVEGIANVPDIAPHVHVTNRSVEQITDVPVHQPPEEIVNVLEVAPQVHVTGSVELITDVPVRQTVEETEKVPNIVLHEPEMISRVELIIDVPVQQTLEVIANVLLHIPRLPLVRDVLELVCFVWTLGVYPIVIGTISIYFAGWCWLRLGIIPMVSFTILGIAFIEPFVLSATWLFHCVVALGAGFFAP